MTGKVGRFLHESTNGNWTPKHTESAGLTLSDEVRSRWGGLGIAETESQIF
jgi:hypothetical protein